MVVLHGNADEKKGFAHNARGKLEHTMFIPHHMAWEFSSASSGDPEVRVHLLNCL